MRLALGLEKVQELNWPVISVGNLSTGGAGKTPLTIELARLLSAAGVSIDILSRGYGRKSLHAASVNPEGSAVEFGDEPLLIAQATGLPVYVARHRYEAGIEAELNASIEAQSTATTNSLQIHLLDDGFQHRQLHRSIDILLMNHRDWNDWLLPAGILRASVIAIPCDEAELEKELRAAGFKGPIWRLKRTMEVAAAIAKLGASGNQPIAGFCGIAHAAPFFEGINSAGIPLVARVVFPDHHPYSESDLHQIIESAQKAGATALLTTEKDLARLGAQRQLLETTMPIASVGLRTEILEAERALSWIFERLRGQN
jgi:tetraacyldisaccharide 4'-kinase